MEIEMEIRVFQQLLCSTVVAIEEMQNDLWPSRKHRGGGFLATVGKGEVRLVPRGFVIRPPDRKPCITRDKVEVLQLKKAFSSNIGSQI